MQVAGAAVIAQPFPQTQHCLLIRACQIGKRRESCQKALKIRHNCGNQGLLQHDLAEPDAVRIAIGAPGKFALIGFEPAQQPLANFWNIFERNQAGIISEGATLATTESPRRTQTARDNISDLVEAKLVAAF